MIPSNAVPMICYVNKFVIVSVKNYFFNESCKNKANTTAALLLLLFNVQRDK